MDNRPAQEPRAGNSSFTSFPRVSSRGGEVDTDRGKADPGLYI